MLRGVLVSAIIVFWWTNSTLADSIQEALLDRYTAECSKLSDCDAVLRFGEAFECSVGKCKCHSNATLDEVNKQCNCNTGFHKFGNKCLEVPDVEGSGRAAVPVVGPGCSADTDCGDHQVCEQNSCRCQANYTIVNNNCVRAALFVGDACDYNEQCTFSLGGRSSCKMSRCVCDEGNIPANNRTACLLLKGLLESCVVSEQCKTNYSSCITSVCSCKANYVNDDTRACLPIVHKFEETCSIPTQCHNGKLGPGSQCAKTGPDEGKCICLSSYHYNQSKKKCLLTRGHGEECDNENTGCYLPLDEEKQGIECKNKKCQCKKKHVLSEDKQHCNSAFTQHGSFLVILLSAILSRRW